MNCSCKCCKKKVLAVQELKKKLCVGYVDYNFKRECSTIVLDSGFKCPICKRIDGVFGFEEDNSEIIKKNFSFLKKVKVKK